MNFERLTARNKNGLAYLVNVKPNEQEVDSPHKNTLKCILDCFERLAQYEDAEIARQSVTSEDNWEELREEFMRNLRGCDTVTISLSGIGSTDYSTEDIHNMIASLTDIYRMTKIYGRGAPHAILEYCGEKPDGED